MCMYVCMYVYVAVAPGIEDTHTANTQYALQNLILINLSCRCTGANMQCACNTRPWKPSFDTQLCVFARIFYPDTCEKEYKNFDCFYITKSYFSRTMLILCTCEWACAGQNKRILIFVSMWTLPPLCCWGIENHMHVSFSTSSAAAPLSSTGSLHWSNSLQTWLALSNSLDCPMLHVFLRPVSSFTNHSASETNTSNVRRIQLLSVRKLSSDVAAHAIPPSSMLGMALGRWQVEETGLPGLPELWLVDCLGSVEASWACEDAVKMHLKESLALLLRILVRSFCFNQCDLHIWSSWAWVLRKDAMNWCRDSKEMMLWSQPNMFLCCIWLNMSLHLHVFAVQNRYAPQGFCTCLNVKVLFGCAQSQGVMYNEGEMAPCRAYCLYMFYMAWMALHRGLVILFHTCKKGWLCADAGFSVFHAYHTEVKMALQRGFIAPLFIHACIAKPGGSMPSPYLYVLLV